MTSRKHNAQWMKDHLERKPRSVKWLVKKSGLAPKTIYRYLAVLEDDGVEVHRNLQSEYFIPSV